MSMSDSTDALREYASALFAPEDDVLRWIQSEADRHELPTISLKPDEARLLQVLVRAIDARTVAEFGTLAGYSGVWLARALAPGGRLYTLESSERHAQVAQRSFEHAGVADRVTIVKGAVRDSLKKIERYAPFDLVFMDADPPSYVEYLAWAVEALRPGGILAAHNAFSEGNVIAPNEPRSEGMAAFNQAVASSERFDSVVVGRGEGLLIAVKRG
jgi:caffeoyl-CoA O-methyltransferase